MPVTYHMGRFPPDRLDLVSLVPLIGQAHAALARYDGLLAAVPESSVLLAPLMTQEAVLSSKIEGTQVTMGEVLQLEAGADPSGFSQPQRDDIEEVLNYRAGLRFASASLVDRPLSQSLLRETHAMLMRGVRGQDKWPGSYRTEQNWIGPKGCSLGEASFVPIAPEHLVAGMDLWTAYVADRSQPDPIVQLAVAHVEFEALHPFRDGNGRLGRMVIPLFLYQRGLLQSPDFYMSRYFERDREAYVDRLRNVSRDDDWRSWCGYFLTGIIEQAKANERKARAILELREKIKGEMVELTHSQHSIRVVDFVFQYPIFSSTHFVSTSGVPKPSAMRILRLLRDSEILYVVREPRGRRPGIYAFAALLDVAEGP